MPAHFSSGPQAGGACRHESSLFAASLARRRFEKIASNVQEARARDGTIIAIATEGETRVAASAEDVFYIPNCDPLLTPVLAVIPLQLLAHFVAVRLGCNVDQSRNLAKSVTVE